MIKADQKLIDARIAAGFSKLQEEIALLHSEQNLAEQDKLEAEIAFIEQRIEFTTQARDKALENISNVFETILTTENNFLTQLKNQLQTTTQLPTTQEIK